MSDLVDRLRDSELEPALCKEAAAEIANLRKLRDALIARLNTVLVQDRLLEERLTVVEDRMEVLRTMLQHLRGIKG
jgi:hypothetical protein